MLDQSLFNKSEVVAKSFDFPKGKVTLYFRRLSCAEYASLCTALVSNDIGERAEGFAWAVKQSLCNKDGSQADKDGVPVISLEQVKLLKEEPFNKIIAAILEINAPLDGGKP